MQYVRRVWWGLVLGAVALSGCGGGGESRDPVEGLVTSASVAACTDVEVHDTGRVTYLLLARNCPAFDSQVVRIQVATATGAVTYDVTIPGIDVATPLSSNDGFQRTLSVHRKGSWLSYPNTDSWGWRDGAGLLVKDGRLYLLGGYRANEGSQNEVWASDDLRSWTRLLETAPWTGRHGAGWLVHDDKLWVIGGDLGVDVWSSPDGVTWTQATDNAPFGKRYTPNAVSDGRRIFLYAGIEWLPYDWCAFAPECQVVGRRDVWTTTDGVSWQRSTPEAPWEGRGLIHGGAYFRGRIYLVGGGTKMAFPGTTAAETVQEFSDIWSSADGVNWRLEASDLGFIPRTHFSIAATPSGCFVSDGSVGTQANFSNEVFFADDCVHFRPIPDPSPMQRRHASSMAYFNGSIVILGGPPLGGPETTAGTAIWQYFPDLPDS